MKTPDARPAALRPAQFPALPDVTGPRAADRHLALLAQR
jgi:hypothetical protein